MIEVNGLVGKNSIRPRGEFYEAEVPDTLDLAERARLAINNQTGNFEPEMSYGVYQEFRFDGAPEMGGLTWNLTAKNARVLPLLRTMSGDGKNLGIECDLMFTLLGQVDEDGLAYVPVDNDGAPKGTAYPLASGALVQAAANWYERDGNPAWLPIINSISTGLESVAIGKGDRAYYPPECGYAKGEWLWTTRGEAKIPYTPPEEPETEQQGLEGCVKFEQYAPLRAMVLNHRMNRSDSSRDMARKIARFCLKPGMWEDTISEGNPGNEHGTFAGHFYGNVASLLALMDLAVAEDDAWLKQFVREGYDHGRRAGIIRMGWFPCWINPEKYNRPAAYFLWVETCCVSAMLMLAVKLTDAGLGDYWDDVDSIVRNHLIAQQITDLDEMRRLGGGHRHDDELKRFLGGFNASMECWPNSTGPHMWGCCSTNGPMGLYYAWHGITRFQDGIATVNLFLNRASAWMDVDSYLPYEGKLVLRNKKARMVNVRIPYWLANGSIECRVNGETHSPPMSGNYLVFSDLEPSDTIQLAFDVPETTEKYTIGDRVYTLSFRGSTLVDITPRDENPRRYQYYRRQHMKAREAPMKTKRRFVADKIIPLQ